MAKCTCINCPDCGGTGTVWFSFDGTYLGCHRSDDLDNLETCDSCRGSGISERCDECENADIYDEDY